MLVLPLWYYSFLTPELATYITQSELIAAVAVFYTLGSGSQKMPRLLVNKDFGGV